MIYEKCRDILIRECTLIQEAVVIQEKLRLAVVNREWVEFESRIGNMNEIENKLASLDEEREQLFMVFGVLVQNKNLSIAKAKDAKGRFYEMVSMLPEKQRSDLTAVYRSLKMEALKLRIANEALMTYLSGVRSTYKEFFDVVFPERGGKMYTSDGTHLSSDMRSIVLNQSF